MGKLEGRVAVVTGAGRGIGASVARMMAREGAAVVVNDLGANVDGTGGDDSPAQQVVNEIKTAGGRAKANFADISNHEAAEGLIRTALDEFGRLDVLVNVAGILRDRMVFNMTGRTGTRWSTSTSKAHSTPAASPPSIGGRRARGTTG